MSNKTNEKCVISQPSFANTRQECLSEQCETTILNDDANTHDTIALSDDSLMLLKRYIHFLRQKKQKKHKGTS